jgi:methyl-accepting chemotaxis protein
MKVHHVDANIAPELVRIRALTTKVIAGGACAFTLVVGVIAYLSGNNFLGVLGVGAVASLVIVLQARRAPASLATRYIAAAVLAVEMMLAIYAAHGTPDGFALDAHMIFFIFNAVLAFYFCWRVLLFYVGLVVVHHASLAFLAPLLVWPSDLYSFHHLVNHVLLTGLQVPLLLFMAVRLSKVFNDAHAATCAAQKESRTAMALAAQLEEQSTEAEAERRHNDEVQAASSAEQDFVVEKLAGGLRGYAAGAMMLRLNEPFPPKYEPLRQDFNTAMSQAEDSLRGIIASIEVIRSGSRDISQAADNLSGRTERQAASLQETSAALDEITTAVHKTAEGAAHARDVVKTAKSNAEKGGTIARQAIGAMGGIEKSSQQIGEIIGVIDEIAFQTNLLALNAGVEAARAGEAGRGFAVVASEVRALAQRSAEAAKEIKALINASRGQVEQGVDLVLETGKALEAIFTQVAEIDTVVSAIAASAQEEATGLNEVTAAIGVMDQSTQQNAAMVEESTAASHALAEETEELTHLVNRFQVSPEKKPVVEAKGRARAA